MNAMHGAPVARALLLALFAGMALRAAPALQGSGIASSLYAIGGERDSAGVALGIPNAVALDAVRVWIADEGRTRVVVFDERAGRAATFGRAGDGPGEFKTLSAIVLLDSNRAAVLDRYHARISILEYSRGVVSLVRTITSPGIASTQGMCMRGGRYIVSGWRDDKLLHELDASGAVVRSFGEQFRTEPEFRALQSGGRGRVLCVNGGATAPAFVAGSEDYGMVRAYSATGELLWAASAPGFRAMVAEPVPGGGISYKYPPEGSYHHIVSVFTVDNGRSVFVQVGEINQETRRKELIAKVVTHVFDGATGKLLRSLTTLPRLDAIAENRAAGIDNALYPTVRVFRLTQ